MRKNCILFLLLLTSVTMLAQKIDQRLSGLVRQNNVRRAQGLTVNPQRPVYDIAAGYDQKGTIRSVGVQAYLRQGAECPTRQLEKMGIEVRYTVDNVAVLNVPVDKLAELENVEEIQFVKADALQQKDNDLSRYDTKAANLTDNISATAAGLPQAYTGKGVLVGIIDGGIDFNHAAFKDANGNTRIKKVVMFTDNFGGYTEYTTPAQIEKLTTDDSSDSHGTHTSATAVGTELGNLLGGVAPEADIMMVAMGKTTSESNMAQGMQLIADFAKQLGKPCIITMSMGIYTDLHDGSSVVCKKVRELTEGGNKAGIAVCISSGNAASYSGTIVHTLGEADADGWQMKTLVGYTEMGATPLPYYIQPTILIYATDGSDFTADLRLVNIETGEVKYVYGNFLAIDGLDFGTMPTKQTSVSLKKDSNYPNAKGGTSVVYRSYFEDVNSYLKQGYEKYRLAIFIKGTTGQEIRIVSGDKSCSEPQFIVPTSAEVLAADHTYVAGSGTLSCNSNVCDDAVISVGSYVSRNSWNYYKQGSQPDATLGISEYTHKPIELGSISEFSSYADADDNGKPRPTLLGPGEKVCSAINIFNNNIFKPDGTIIEDDYDVMTGKMTKKTLDNLAPEYNQILGRFDSNHYYGFESGTSMSTPHVAGVLALWMQADPTLTVNRIKDIMSKTCRKDAYCTDINKIVSMSTAQAGYGKIDALEGLKMIKGTDAIEAIVIGGHREATPATMYSVDAPVYNLQGQRVDKSHKGLVIYKGRVYLNK